MVHGVIWIASEENRACCVDSPGGDKSEWVTVGLLVDGGLAASETLKVSIVNKLFCLWVLYRFFDVSSEEVSVTICVVSVTVAVLLHPHTLDHSQ